MLDFTAAELNPVTFLTSLRQDKAGQLFALPATNILYIGYRSGEPNESLLFDLLYDPVCLYASRFFSSEEDASVFANMVVLEFFTIEITDLPFKGINELMLFLFAEVSNYCVEYGAILPKAEYSFLDLDRYRKYKITERLAAKGLHKVIETLSEPHKQIIKLCILKQYSVEQISAEMQISVQAVKKHRLAAIRIIKAKLLK